MYSEQMIFLRCFEKGLSILQISIKSYVLINCLIFEIGFFFKVGLPPETSKFGLKNSYSFQQKKKTFL